MTTIVGGRRSYAAVHPVAAMICDILPENERETTPSEVHFEDLEKIQVDDVARISEWLTEKARLFLCGQACACAAVCSRRLRKAKATLVLECLCCFRWMRVSRLAASSKCS